jgi:hypothetical protein
VGDKRIAVSMSEEWAAIIKEYCSFYRISQSDALYLFAVSAIESHSLNCKKVKSIFALRQKELDKRAGKPCFGYSCLSCAHTLQCSTGLYQGLFKISQKYEHLSNKEDFMVKMIALLEEYGFEPT